MAQSGGRSQIDRIRTDALVLPKHAEYQLSHYLNRVVDASKDALNTRLVRHCPMKPTESTRTTFLSLTGFAFGTDSNPWLISNRFIA
jgi:hypothetical protein